MFERNLRRGVRRLDPLQRRKVSLFGDLRGRDGVLHTRRSRLLLSETGKFLKSSSYVINILKNIVIYFCCFKKIQFNFILKKSGNQTSSESSSENQDYTASQLGVGVGLVATVVITGLLLCVFWLIFSAKIKSRWNSFNVRRARFPARVKFFYIFHTILNLYI